MNSVTKETVKENEIIVQHAPIVNKLVYKMEEIEIKKIECEKDIFIRLLELGNNKYIDIRKYYKGYPTKRGLRFKYDQFLFIKKILNDEF